MDSSGKIMSSWVIQVITKHSMHNSFMVYFVATFILFTYNLDNNTRNYAFNHSLNIPSNKILGGKHHQQFHLWDYTNKSRPLNQVVQSNINAWCAIIHNLCLIHICIPKCTYICLYYALVHTGTPTYMPRLCMGIHNIHKYA
jgi:hypothetical protein